MKREAGYFGTLCLPKASFGEMSVASDSQDLYWVDELLNS